MFNLILLQFIAHFIGDYYLQSGMIAMKKSDSYYYTFLHSVIYVIPFYVIWLLFCQYNMYLLFYTSILAWSHCFVDLGKVYLNIHQNKFKEKGYGSIVNAGFLYVIDQFIHYFLICFVSILMLEKVSLIYSFCLLGIDLLLVILYQPYYVSAKILFLTDKSISNTFSKCDCLLKLSGMLVGFLCLLCPFWLQILFLCFGMGYWFYSKKDVVIYWNGALLVCMAIIPLLGI